MPHPSTENPADPLAWLSELEGVPSAFAATRDGVDVMLRDRGLRKSTPEQTAESLLRGAHASAVLEGSASSMEDLRADAGDAVAQAALRVSTEVLSLVPVLGRSPAQAFARLHALTGGPAPGQPISPEKTDRLQSLSRTMLSTTAPAMIVAALVHADLMAAQPFADRNGIVARAAERLVLVARGVDPASLVVPEAGHLALRAEYESNLRGYRDGGRNGLHGWLLYAAQAQAKGAEASPLRLR
ncbi:MAG: hypothetical protein JWR90_1080 [Marmoricola sp.]|nr:hypothetical protein [Marmoricola sp.]